MDTLAFIFFWAVDNSGGGTNPASWLSYIVPTVVALAGVIFAAYKLRPERDSITTASTKTAVEVFKSSIDRLEAELKEARSEIAGLETRLKRMEEEYQVQIDDLIRQRDNAISEAKHLADRVIMLERENFSLREYRDTTMRKQAQWPAQSSGPSPQGQIPQ